MIRPTRQLKEFCRIIQGGRLGLSGNHFVPQGFPAYGAGGMNGYLPVHEFDEPAVILSSIGARCGKCFYADGKWTSLANTQLIFPDPKEAAARFLWFQLNDEKRWHRSGTGQPFIKPADVKAHRVYLPPLAVQQRIAAVLDKAEELRQKRRAGLSYLDSFSQSLFLNLFGNPATNQSKWLACTLGDVLLTIRNGANAEQRTEPNGWPITRIETISDGTIDPERVRWIEPDESLLDDFKLQPGDILFSHINSVEHIGKTALYSGEPTPLIHGINLLRLRPKLDVVDPVWLLHLLKNDAVRNVYRTRCKRAVNQASLNQPDIKSLAISLPPLAPQQDFAHRLRAVERLQVAHRASLTEMDSLFAALQHRAFNGEL